MILTEKAYLNKTEVCKSSYLYSLMLRAL